jgi:hypothetical protein
VRYAKSIQRAVARFGEEAAGKQDPQSEDMNAAHRYTFVAIR